MTDQFSSMNFLHSLASGCAQKDYEVNSELGIKDCQDRLVMSAMAIRGVRI